MKQSKPAPRASHVNSGTAIPHHELPWPDHVGPVMRMPKLHVETEERATVTRFGGLALFEQFCRRFRVAPLIDEHVEVLKVHLPYHESDHVLAQAMNLYVGGTCIEDMMYLQHDEAVLRIVGACRLPDPTTAGDFLRRFEPSANAGALGVLRKANDELQARVWQALSPRNGRRRRKRQWAVIDVDSHIKPLCGVQKQGADYSYKGQWSYHPLVVSMAATGECLAVVNRAGCASSADGAGDVMHEVLPRVVERFRNVIVRGDSAFDRQDLREVIEHYEAYFAFVAPNDQPVRDGRIGWLVGPLSGDTFKRLACDCGLIVAKTDDQGNPLDIGTRRRTVSAPLLRALFIRDRHCQFPGCTLQHQAFLDAHHIEHWLDHGPTNKSNTCLVCHHHHVELHEGGFSAKRNDDGSLTFYDPQGRAIEPRPTVPQLSHTGRAILRNQASAQGLHIDHNTSLVQFNGSGLDLRAAVDALLSLEYKLSPSPTEPHQRGLLLHVQGPAATLLRLRDPIGT